MDAARAAESLFYYTSEAEKQCKGSLSLREIVHVTISSKKDGCVELVAMDLVSGRDKNVFLFHEDTAELKDWLIKIKNAVIALLDDPTVLACQVELAHAVLAMRTVAVVDRRFSRVVRHARGCRCLRCASGKARQRNLVASRSVWFHSNMR